jgi:hypothetical protein
MKYLCLYPEEKLYFSCIFCILKGENKQILLSSEKYAKQSLLSFCVFIMLWLSIEHSIIVFYNPTQTILYIYL